MLSGCYSTAPAIVEVLFPSSISNHETDHCLGLLTSTEGEFSDESGEINFRPELKGVGSILWREKESSFTLLF